MSTAIGSATDDNDDIVMLPPPSTSASSPLKLILKFGGVKSEEVPMDPDSLFPYTPSLKRKKGRSVEERIAALKADPRCGDVEPHQVFCLICDKWIQLYRGTEYIDSNWLRHAERHSCVIRTDFSPCL